MNGIETKEGYTLRACDNCKKAYYADNRNLKRGWGMCCSKKCAAVKREKKKPGYNPQRVAENNYRRCHWNFGYDRQDDSYGGLDDGLDYLSECGDKD